MKPICRTVADQPSWIIRSRDVELAVTQLGGHMAPVTFYRGSARPVRPYYVNPWHGEGLKLETEVLRPLRGDFFCMPFGGNAEPYQDEKHIVHGEPACRPWRLVGAERDGGVTSLTMSMTTKVRPGKVTKRLCLADGQNAVYIAHELEGYSGPMPLGHHAILAMPEEPETVLVSTSPIRFGLTNPFPPAPGGREYYSLAPGKRFGEMSCVPLVWKDQPVGECTKFPTRPGYTDILTVCNRPGKTPAWTAAVNASEGFLWFSLKDPAVLPTTVMWIANRGRHGAPWNGRNCCLGLEDVCAFLAEGLAPSVRRNALSRAGVPTFIRLSPRRPTAVRCIQGVVKVPRGFGRVVRAVFAPGKVTFFAAGRRKVSAAVHHEFLHTGRVTT